MLEVLTLRYSDLPQGILVLIGYCFIVLGGVLAATLLPRQTDRLSRSWYFLRLGLASFLFAACQLLWFLFIPAVKLGVSFALVLTDVASEMAYGGFILHLALARSRDAYGHDGRGWFAFVPFANLFLLFKAPQQLDATPGSVGAALVGVVLFGMSRAVTAMIEGSGDHFAAEVAADPVAIATLRDLRIRAQGIEAALDDLILAEAAPRQLDPGLDLTSVSRIGSHVTYDFTADLTQDETLASDFRREVMAQMCSGLMPYLVQGATAALHYGRRDGSEIETLALSLTECTT